MGYCPYCNAYVLEGTGTCGNCGQTSQVIPRTYDESYSYNYHPMYTPQQIQPTPTYNTTRNPSNSPSYSPTYNPTPSTSGYGSQYAAQTEPSIFSYQPYQERRTSEILASLGLVFIALALFFLPLCIVGIIFGALAMTTGSKPLGLIVISMGMMELAIMIFYLVLFSSL